MECKYRHKDGSFSKTRFIIQGPIYYALVGKYKSDENGVNDFLQSFTITPFRYPAGKELRDSSMFFTVISLHPSRTIRMRMMNRPRKCWNCLG
jgi:hypothetical protein